LRTEVGKVEQRQGLAAGGKSGETIAKSMLEKFPNGVKVTSTAANRVNATVDRGLLYKVAEFLKNEMDFEHVTSVSGVDWYPENRMQAVFHITSYANRVTAEIIVDLPRDSPEVDSVTPLWGGANWNERETYDMFGIIFKGHPRLERILTAPGSDYFPYRKDFAGGRRV